ncbi:MAG: ATP-dependent helicase [Lachnospiraceae bacterium]|nr:ATP-dependent helicase [Lachnospiraceae bacterium]
MSENEPMVASFLRNAYQKVAGGFATEADLQDVRMRIAYIKNMACDSQQIQNLKKECGYDIGRIYRGYCDFMKKESRMDFDDQLVYAYRILQADPKALALVQDRYRYICVDEAQDTSLIQHELIAMLAKKGKRDNLFMVGDEDQSIYGFRAAYPQALLAFEKVHEGARILLMETNYRSDANIVKAAARLIKKNKFRHEKTMVASAEACLPIRKISLAARSAQYSYLEKVAKDATEETAILFRDNESALPLIDRLERAGIPYRMRGSDLVFFSRKMIRDITDIIAFAKDPYDTQRFMNIYYKVGSYLTKEYATAACGISRAQGIPVLDAISGSESIPRRTQENCQQLQRQLKELGRFHAKDGLNFILGTMGYGAYMDRVKMDRSKIFVLRALAGREANLDGLVRRLSELQEICRQHRQDTDCPLILSTIHSSKGLEYDEVYILDVLDGVFPDQRPDNVVYSSDVKTKQELEEQRRLFYVAVTRAKKRLNIFAYDHAPSTFLTELLGKYAVNR